MTSGLSPVRRLSSPMRNTPSATPATYPGPSEAGQTLDGAHAPAGPAGIRESEPMPRPLTIQRRTTLLQEALAVIEAEYARDLELDDVARRIATSRRQLQRCFDELGDASFRECLTRERMDRAADLLAGTGLTVKEVAHRVGYRQPAQFAKAFRRRHGVSPSEYRAAHRTMRPPAALDRADRIGRAV